ARAVADPNLYARLRVAANPYDRAAALEQVCSPVGAADAAPRKLERLEVGGRARRHARTAHADGRVRRDAFRVGERRDVPAREVASEQFRRPLVAALDANRTTGDRV